MLTSCIMRKNLSLLVMITLAVFLTGCPIPTPPSSLVIVPSVLGMTQSAAETTLAGVNLVVGTVTMETSATVAAGQVIRQNPVADTEVDSESSVSLVISSGSGTSVTVPNLVGMTQSAAMTALTTANLVPGTISQEASETVAVGNVIRQAPISGMSVVSGSSVAFVVSSGLEPVTVPNVVGFAQIFATAAIRNTGLTVGTITQEFTTTVAAGKILRQTPSGGSSVASGTVVNLVVAVDVPGITVPDVMGLTLEAAQAAVTNAGLTVGTVSYEYVLSKEEGTVIDQNPTVSTSVSSGSSVNLVLATHTLSQVVFSVSPEQRVVNQASGMTTFAVSNKGIGTMSWTASVTSGSWLRVSSGSQGTNSGTITISYEANTGKEARTGTIQVTASGAKTNSKQVTVIQAGSDTKTILSITPIRRDVSSDSGSTTFAVSNAGTGTMAWTASVTSGNWLRVSSGSTGVNNGAISVSYDANTGTESRTGTILVTASGAMDSPQQITVIQGERPVLSITPIRREVSSDSGSTTFAVTNANTSTMAWTASVISGNWLRVSSGANGINSGTISVSYDANTGTESRMGTIQVTASGAIDSPQQITVIQGKRQSLLIAPPQREVTFKSGSTTFDVSNTGTGTMTWTASVTSGSWLRISSGATGINSGTITVSYDDNLGKETRTGKIQVTASGATDNSQEITVIQSATKILWVVGDIVDGKETQERKVLSSAGSTTFALYNKGAGQMLWTALVTTEKWLHISSGGSGINDETIMVSFEANPGPKRLGKILVTALGAENSPMWLGVAQGGYGDPPTIPILKSFFINHDAAITTLSTNIVELEFDASGDPTQYMASESLSFEGAQWQNFPNPPEVIKLTLSKQNGIKTVYFKVKNAVGESNVGVDTIIQNTYTEYYYEGMWKDRENSTKLSGITVDSLGNVYVVDTGNNHVEKYDPDGTFLTKWGTSGSDNGQFAAPWGIAVDASDNIYIADAQNNRIQKFTNNGTFLISFGSGGTGYGQFIFPCCIALDASGNIYVLDRGNDRIQKFSAGGTFLTAWGSSGTGNGQFALPQGIAIDASDNVYVADTFNNRIQKFSADGTFLTKWGGYGEDTGQFYLPSGLAADIWGNIFVTDTGNNRIQKLSTEGTFSIMWGSEGADVAQLNGPRAVAVNSLGNVYIADSNNSRILRFVPDH